MRIVRRLGASLVIVLPLLLPGSARSACGDGTKQAGEACDASAPGGDAACPGRCVPVGSADQCTCASPSSDGRSYVLIASGGIKLGGGATVFAGDVAVTGSGGQLQLSPDAQLPATGQAIGDQAAVLSRAAVGRLFANELRQGDGANIGAGPFPFTPPLAITLPSSPGPANPGGDDVAVAENETKILAPGRYQRVTVGQRGRLLLRGLSSGEGIGRYDFQALKVAFEGRVLAGNPVIVRVADRVGLAGQTVFGPDPSVPLLPGDIHLEVSGSAVRVSRGSSLSAHVRAPAAKFVLGSGAQLSGQAIAARATAGKQAALVRVGGCGDGVLSAGEECDLSAPNGDSACPGSCIRGDLTGQGRIEVGDPGQCRCRCSNDGDCDDGDACDGIEQCQGGVCMPGTPPNCDDGNPCTKDCDPQVGCKHTNRADGSGCSDDNLCTRNDTCQGGVCVPGETRDCSDGNSCTTDSCTPTGGCAHTALADGVSCEDGSACTTQDACIHGACVGGPAPDCDTNNVCAIGSCDPIKGCVSTPVPDGSSCAGTSPCSVRDTCDKGACVSGVKALCDDGNPCTTESCTVTGTLQDPVAQCGYTTLPNFTPCGQNKVCFFGVCQ